MEKKQDQIPAEINNNDVRDELVEGLGTRWRLEHLIGRGGVGHVYATYDTLMARPVALKALVAYPEGLSDPVPSFLNEIRLLGRLRHPNIVTLYDAGSFVSSRRRPIYYMVMEYLSALDLGTVLDHQNDFLIDETIQQLILGILRGLHYLHKQGILHRDLKPGNILIGDDGVRLTDFDYALDLNDIVNYSVPVTPRGSVAYISPEQIRGEPGDFRSDLYAVGTILYELLTGQLPFDGDDPADIINQQLAGEMRPVEFVRPEANLQLAEVAERLLSVHPEDRYANAVEVLRAIDPR